jgi:SAM-dependent methyltransferase
VESTRIQAKISIDARTLPTVTRRLIFSAAVPATGRHAKNALHYGKSRKPAGLTVFSNYKVGGPHSPDEVIMVHSEPNTWQDDKYLQTVQYADSNRLSARANIHAKYGRGDWFSWLASQPNWPWEGDVLEVGCGAGWFWTEAASQLPARLRIQLTDLSHGMVTEALKRVRASDHWNQVEGRVADASALPFPDASFDVVLASHMLYHLHDPRDGVTEIARVLRSNGTAVIATNGISNMRELLDLRRSVFGGEHGDQVSSAFTLENGRPILEPVFKAVELRQYPDRLVCTDPRDIIDYLTSSPPGDDASEQQIEALREAVTIAFQKNGGKFTVTKDIGVFLCREIDIDPHARVVC